MSSEPLPDVLTVADVARLCGTSVEWVKARRLALPCSWNVRTLELNVARGDLAMWLAAAQPRREVRVDEVPEAFVELQARYGGSPDRSGVIDRATGDIKWAS